ncbi:MAG: hypothetical protein JXA43_02750 [Candidatus Diapherotrites archaeon]|nr:hypothetical protein [Candidatus Diapherotrites archaeon]
MKNLINLLGQLGLTEYQSKVYATLISYGSLTAKDIAQKSGVPTPKVYTALEDLEKRAIIAYYPSYPKRYSATNAELVLRRLLDEKREKIHDLTHNVEEIMGNLDKYKKPAPLEKELESYVWVAQGYKEALLRASDMVKNAKKEVLMATGTFTISPQLSAALRKAIKTNNIDVKVIGPKNPNALKNVEQYTKIGCKARFTDFSNEHPRMLLIDGKFSALRIGKDHVHLIVDDPGFGIMARNCFMALWNAGEEVKKQ